MHIKVWRKRTLLKLFALTATAAAVLGTAGFVLVQYEHSVALIHPAQVMVKTRPYAQKTPAASVAPNVLDAPDYTIPLVTNGVAPVISHLPTKQPVVFLGIDDGGNKQQFEIDLMRQNNIKASLFLADRFIWNNYDFFKGFKDEGSVIEDHTLHHPNLTTLSFDQQKQEICGMADVEQKQYGRRPILFRPPGGSYNLTTQRAAAACGMKAVVMWIAKANGGSMQYQIGHSLRAGDIVLMHFRPEFKQDLQAFINAQNAAHLHTVLLENWLAPNS